MKNALDVLKHIKSMPDGVITDSELRRYLGNDYNQRVQQLIEDGFIVEASYAMSSDAFEMVPVTYKLSIKGRDRVAAHFSAQQKKRKQHARKNAQTAADKREAKTNRIKAFYDQLAIAIIASAVTLVIEHFDVFIGFVEKLFFK